MNQTPQGRSPIQVLVVDDSAFMRAALSRMIASDCRCQVVATASDGLDALEKIAVFDPDVVTLDLEMPVLNGLEALRRIMVEMPRPVIMVSSMTEKDAQTTFDALAAGAFDYVPKHLLSDSLDISHIRVELIEKILAAAQTRRPRVAAVPERKPPLSLQFFPSPWDTTECAPAVVAIGISTGGPKALHEILPMLPADLSVPILIVQHMPPGFTGAFAERMNSLCSVRVKEACDGEPILPGIVYMGPYGLHLRVRGSIGEITRISLNPEPKDSLHIPSVDVLMKSTAECYRNHAMGIIMTGMGHDGAEGMTAIYRSGGLTMGQDEGTCTVYGMPRACAELGILSHIVPLTEIPQQILLATRHRKRA